MRSSGRAGSVSEWRSDAPLSSPRLLDAKARDNCDQSARLSAQALRGGGALLDQRGVLLRALVHLRDRVAHLTDADALLAARRGDLRDDVADLADRCDDLVHRHAGAID